MAGGYGNNEHFKTSVTSLPSFTEFTSSLRLVFHSFIISFQARI